MGLEKELKYKLKNVISFDVAILKAATGISSDKVRSGSAYL
jgi:hypothetical protein